MDKAAGFRLSFSTSQFAVAILLWYTSLCSARNKHKNGFVFYFYVEFFGFLLPSTTLPLSYVTVVYRR